MTPVLRCGMVLSLALGAMVCTTGAMANDSQKITVAKNAIKKADAYQYASPSLKQLIDKANKIQYRIEPDMGCDVVEDFYMGHGNGDAGVAKLNATVLKNGKVRATWIEDWGNNAGGDRYGEKRVIDFDMTCKGNTCTIDNIKNVSDNVDFKKDLQYIVQHGTCSFG